MSEAVLTRSAGACDRVLRSNDHSIGREALAAAIRGGFAFSRSRCRPPARSRSSPIWRATRAVIGVGTVLTVEQAPPRARRGALPVSPVIDVEVAAEAARLGSVMIPGCATPTELWSAHRAGRRCR